jgi:hypothetical protein
VSVRKPRSEQIDHTASTLTSSERRRKVQIKWKQKLKRKDSEMSGTVCSCKAMYVRVQQESLMLEKERNNA